MTDSLTKKQANTVSTYSELIFSLTQRLDFCSRTVSDSHTLLWRRFRTVDLMLSSLFSKYRMIYAIKLLWSCYLMVGFSMKPTHTWKQLRRLCPKVTEPTQQARLWRLCALLYLRFKRRLPGVSADCLTTVPSEGMENTSCFISNTIFDGLKNKDRGCSWKTLSVYRQICSPLHVRLAASR